MSNLLYNSESHFEYLDARLNSKSSDIKAIKQKFSQAVEIQPSFLSQVLAKKFSLSLEQADLANTFFAHDPNESHFFLLLVSRDRAGNSSLKNFYNGQIEEFKSNLRQHFESGSSKSLSKDIVGIYYSSWKYGAVHFACSIERLNTPEKIAHELKIDVTQVEQILQFLIQNKFVTKKENGFKPKDNWLRIGKQSPFRFPILISWRDRVIENIPFLKPGDIHYSGVYTLDQKKFEVLKEKIHEFIQQSTAEAKDAKEEQLVYFGVDYFKL